MTAATPFSTTAVTYPGQALPRVRAVDDSIWTAYLGTPGNMIELSPVSMVTMPSVVRSRGLILKTLLSGGTVAIRRPLVKRSVTLNWDMLRGRDWELLKAFHAGVYGDGPFCLVTAEDRNRLPASASLAGGVNGDLSKFAVTSGDTLLPDTTHASPILPSAVLSWTPLGTNHLLSVGAGPGDPDVPTATSAGTGVPYLPALPVTVSGWVRTVTGTAGPSLIASGRTVTGTIVAEQSSTLAVTSTWQRFSTSAAAGALSTAPYVMWNLKCAATTTLLVAGLQLEYAAQASDLALGAHVARVQFPELPANLDGLLGKSLQLVFPEA